MELAIENKVFVKNLEIVMDKARLRVLFNGYTKAFQINFAISFNTC